MPMGEVTLNSITLIRVRLGTQRESYREGSRRGGGWRGHGQAETEDRRHRRREIGGGRCMMNRDRLTENTKKTKEQFMFCSLSVQ